MNSQRGRGDGRGSRTVRGSRGGRTGDVSSPIQKNSWPIYEPLKHHSKSYLIHSDQLNQLVLKFLIRYLNVP